MTEWKNRAVLLKEVATPAGCANPRLSCFRNTPLTPHHLRKICQKMCIFYHNRLQNEGLTLTGSAPPHWLGPPPQPAPLSRWPVAFRVVTATAEVVVVVVQMLHAVKRAASAYTAAAVAGSRARTAAAATATATTPSIRNVSVDPVIDMKSSRLSFLVHHWLCIIHGSCWPRLN